MKVKVRIKFDAVWRTDEITLPKHLETESTDLAMDWLQGHFRSKAFNQAQGLRPPNLFYIID